MSSLFSHLRKWISNIPVQDPVDRRMAVLLQVVLIGFISLVVIAAGLNLVIAKEIPRPVILMRTAIAILIIGIPLFLLRRGKYRSSALIIIAIFCFLEGFAVITANLRDIAETLSFFTLAIILAGLLVSPRALIFTFLLSFGLVGYGAFQEWSAGSGQDGIVIAGNFILLNGLISLFLYRFGATLRTALASALAREKDLQNEILERKRTDNELRVSKERYTSLIDQARDVIFTLSTDRLITSLNPSFEVFTGWKRSEWVGRTFDNLVAENDRERAIDQFDRILQGETGRSLRLRMHTQSGEIMVVEMNISPQFKDDQIVGLLGIARDMTQEQLAEDALAQSEDQYRRLIEYSPYGVVVHIQGRLVYSNPAANKLIGAKNSEEVLGKPVLDFVHPDSRPAVIQRLKEMSEGSDAPPLDEKFVRLDGQVIDVEVTAYPFTYQDQSAVQVVIHDVTERKRAREALAASEAKYRAFFDNSMDAILLTSIDGSIYEANPAACRMLERTETEIIQSGRKGLVDPGDQRLAEILAERGKTGKVRGELNLLRKNGTPFPAEISSALFQDNDGKTRTSMILRDITKRKEAEEEREDLIEQLTAKNAELEQFVYTVSHDLKSPLVTIRGFLGYLEEDAVNGNLERLKRDIQRISNAVENMQVLLKDLLELSRIGRFVNPPQVVPFDELAGEAIKVVEGQIQERGVTVAVGPNLPPVYGDRMRLLEVLQNLLDNGIKYMGDQPEPRIEIGYRGMENDRHVFYVRDNGIGIRAEYRERIFGLFNKLDANSEGTGVGLTLVKRIVEYHGGRIWVESEAGEGSTFVFTLDGAPSSN